MSIGGLRSAAAKAALRTQQPPERVPVRPGTFISGHARAARRDPAEPDWIPLDLQGFRAMLRAWIRMEHKGARMRGGVSFRAALDIMDVWRSAWLAANNLRDDDRAE